MKPRSKDLLLCGIGVTLAVAGLLAYACVARGDVVLITNPSNGGLVVIEDDRPVSTDFAYAAESRTTVCLPEFESRLLQVLFVRSDTGEWVLAWALESPCGYDFGDGPSATNYPGHGAATVTVAGSVWTIRMPNRPGGGDPLDPDADTPNELDDAPDPPQGQLLGACCSFDACIVTTAEACFADDWRWGLPCEPDPCE